MDIGQYIADHSHQIVDWALAVYLGGLAWYLAWLPIWRSRPPVSYDHRRGTYVSARGLVAERSYRNRQSSATLDTTTKKGTPNE